jgi:peroxiredoxin Q/BCP
MTKLIVSSLVVLALLAGHALLIAAAPTTRPADFTVFPVGSPFKLSEARGKYVALHFLLKTECPYCLRFTHEYATRSKDQKDVVHIFLKPDSEQAIAQWAGRLEGEKEARPTIYRDPDARLAKAFSIPFGYKFHNEVVHYPALVLLDPDGMEVFRYIGKSNSDRYSFDQFTKKLEELKSR